MGDSDSTAAPRPVPIPEPGEFYYDGPYIVFTEAYHLRRGYCCQSGCRHCPYGFAKDTDAPVTESSLPDLK